MGRKPTPRTYTQSAFSFFDHESKKDFGGLLIKGNPRERRPISAKRAMHLVMRSEHATGTHSFLKKERATRIRQLIERVGKREGVKIYRYANSGNHLHMIILPKSREAFRAFARVISGLIARITLGAERGCGKGLQFWDARPFTRILEWGRDYKIACNYLLKNTLEALGFIHYEPRKIACALGPPG